VKKHPVHQAPSPVILVLIAAVIALFTAAAPPPVLGDGPAAYTGPAGRPGVPAAKGNPKLDSALDRLSARVSAFNSPSLLSGAAPRPAAETVRVIVESAPGRTDAVVGAADSLGDIEGRYGDLFQVVVPIARLTALTEIQGVRFARLPMLPLPAITSQGVPLINANDWQGASYNGSGVRIGVLDIGFKNFTLRQAEGDLPTDLTTWWAPSLGGEGDNAHGTACAEIIYDIAPAATYYLANFETDVEYGNAVEWLMAQGVDVISCSIAWPVGGPGDGTGYIDQVVDTARAAGVFWAQSAGNHISKHWRGDWSDPDADALLNFSGSDEGNTISAFAGDTIVAAVKWDDPWFAASNDYDLQLYDSSGNLTVASTNIQDGDDDPWEVITYTATYTGEYDLAISAFGSPAPVNFHLYSFYHNLQFPTPAGSLLVPADSFSAMAVGAVRYSSPTILENFSSLGPTDDGRIKPDIVAPDGVSTASYGLFYGTSAAAPHTAGAAALVRQRFPAWTPARVQSFLEGRAVDLGGAGKDSSFGSGRLDLGDPASYTLTMAASGSGDVTPAAGAHAYAPGTVVPLQAAAAPGWDFTGWTGEVADPALATNNVTMNGDRAVTANFNLATAGLTILTNGAGTVDPPAGSHDYPLGSTVNITATASANWAFVAWTGDVNNPGSAATNITLDTNKTVTASFVRVSSFLRIDLSGSGDVTPPSGLYVYPVSATVNITAIPAANWAFVAWTGDVADNLTAATSVTAAWDKTVIATFVRTHGTLDLAVSGGGSASASPAAANNTYPVGTTVNITASPAPGWQFSGWSGDVAAVADVAAASTNVTMNADYSITANFSALPASPMSGGGGGGGGGYTSILGLMDSSGRLTQDVVARSPDLQAWLALPRGTRPRSYAGGLLASLYIRPLSGTETGPVSPEHALPVTAGYVLGPGGARFEPPIVLTVSYEPGSLPAGVSENSLSIVRWDDITEQWVWLESRLDAENDAISTVLDHFSLYTVMARTRPADIAVAAITIGPAAIHAGGAAAVEARLSNRGDLAGAYRAVLKIDGTVAGTRDITIAGGDNVTLSFTVAGLAAGDHRAELGGLEKSFTVLPGAATITPPASFQVSSLKISPQEIAVGEQVTVTANAANTGGSAGSYEIVLRVDGTVMGTRQVYLDGGSSREVAFTIGLDSPGKRLIEVNGLSGAVLVGGGAAPPVQTPLPLGEPPPDTTAAIEPPAMSTPEENSSPAGPGWLFGVVGIAGLALAAGLVYFIRRPRRNRRP
jgi:uncharacterized repeat protein (TIGR02543 family)